MEGGVAVDLQWLLDKLCVDLGFCLPRHEQERLLALTFEDADALTRAVLAAEGLDPEHCDRRLYSMVFEMVRRYYFSPPESDTADLQRRLRHFLSRPRRRRRGCGVPTAALAKQSRGPDASRRRRKNLV
jgi:hypothetical protein